MAIYEIHADQITGIAPTTFNSAGLKERSDLQRLLRKQIEIISPDTLVIDEEFGEWDESKRRIDLLGLDKDANLVVIELKRTEDGGHMELQAIRYAAMVSSMTFERAVEVYGRYLHKVKIEDDPRSGILDFLEWDEPDEEQFAQEVRIVLSSADYSKELTTAVIWLNNHGLDIRCMRMRPYMDGERTLLDVQQVIPLPEAEDYQVRIREKAKRERIHRVSKRDTTRFDLVVSGRSFTNLPKRWAIYQVVKYLCDQGVAPEQVAAHIPWRENRLFCSVDGEAAGDYFNDEVQKNLAVHGKRYSPHRWFSADEQLIYFNGRTYCLINQWGRRTLNAIDALAKAYPDANISIQPSQSHA